MLKRYIQTILFYTTLPIMYGIALLPLQWLYKLSDLCFIFVYRIFKYRRNIVWRNLYNAFPSKNVDERYAIERAFYKNLCDLFVECIKCLTITANQAKKRGKLVDAHVLHHLYRQNKHILVVSGHFGNWEWCANTLSLESKYQLCAVYKPLHNDCFNKFTMHLRQRFNRKILPVHRLFTTMYQYKTPLRATALLTDQMPPKKKSYYTYFLNQNTAVFQGTAKLAHLFNQPVVYIQTRRIRRGWYEFRPILLFEDPTTVTLADISEAHTKKLEENIYNQPELWLWSHRRWK